MGEQVFRQIDQHAVAAHADDGLVEADIDLGIFVEVGAHRAVLEGGEHAAQRRDVVVGRGFGHEPRRHAFQRRPGGDQLDDLALGLAHHIDAAPRHRADETLALELRHGLAHRRPADAELVRQAALVEPDLGAASVNVH
jgi:hypothetical protein